MIGIRFLVGGALLLCLIGGTPAYSDVSPQTRVGRISVAEGDVEVAAAGKDWADSGVNDPIAVGMSMRTPARGRAMLQVGSESIALSASTELEIGQLDVSGTQIILRRGRIGVRLSTLDPARSIEIDIPQGGVWLLTPGDYDITASDGRDASRVVALDGRARFADKERDAAVATGSVAVLRGGDAVQTTPDETTADEFVAWWRPAGGNQGEVQALRYVSPELTGYDALDSAGTWATVEGFGAVWFPTEQGDDWAPYRAGHWRWVVPWGWTWIDDKSWGFATSHYGRWAKIAQSDGEAARWGWVPGKIVPHPAYMPAAVAFLGTAGVGLSCPNLIGPAVAWFPLAPGEVYWPSFTDDLGAIQQLNTSAVVDVSSIGPAVNDNPPADIVTAAYRNRRFATVVPRAVFLAGKPTATALVDLPERRLENAPLLAGSPQLAVPAPRPAILATAIATERRVAPKLTKAVQTLARILKPAPGRAAHAKAAVRVARAPVSHLRPAAARSARPRSAHAPTARVADLRQTDIRRR